MTTPNKPATPRTRRAKPEEIAQKALVAWARAAANAGWTATANDHSTRIRLDKRQCLALRYLHHSRNGGMSKGENGRAKAMGTIRGYPDLFLAYHTIHAAGLYIEMKDKSGSVDKAQREVHEALRTLGYAVAVAWSDAEAQDAIIDHFTYNPDFF